MTQTTNYKRSFSGSMGAGMKSIFGSSGRRFYELEFRTGSEKHRAGETQKVIVDQIELGRDSQCGIRFGEDCKTVSRRHAAIIKDGNGWKLVQLSKTNSTYLNEHKVENEWYLQNGDEIQLSTGGPRIGFLVKEGAGSLVKSIGLTNRLSLFRQQALRPYKRALTAVASTLAAVVVAGTIVIVSQQKEIDLSKKEIANLTVNFDAERKAWEVRREKDSLENAHQRDMDAKRYAKQIAAANKRAQEALERASKSSDGASGFAAMIEKQQIGEDIYFLITTKVVFITKDNKEIDLSEYFPYTGTGFLLSDGRFVTARHCIEPWLYNVPDNIPQNVLFAVSYAEQGYGKIKGYYTAINKNKQVLHLTSDNFNVDRSKDIVGELGKDQDGDPIVWRCVMPIYEGMTETMWSTDWAATRSSVGSTGKIHTDSELSRNLLPQQKLLVAGYPKGLGVQDGASIVDPIYYELSTTRKGLANNGCIMHSSGTDHGNSGGPIFTIKDDKLVVIGIVSRGDIKSDHYNWAVPIANIR